MQSTPTFRDRFVGRSVRVLAGIIGVSAAACSSNSTSTPATASSLTVVSGNTQSGTVATGVSLPLVVQVKDQNGNGLSGVSVTFTASGGATLGSATTITDASGNASSTLTLGTTSGTDSVTAVAAGVSTPVVFTLTANAGAPSALVVTAGNNQTGTAGTTLANALVVEVTDQYGNAVSGATVNWVTTAGTIVGTAQSSTDATGTVSSTLQLPTVAGPVTVTATVQGTLITAVFAETAM